MKFKSLEGKRLEDNKLTALLENASGSWTDRFRQTTINHVKRYRPSIPTKSNPRIVDFLGVLLPSRILIPIQIWVNNKPFSVNTINQTILLSLNIFVSPISPTTKELLTKQGPLLLFKIQWIRSIHFSMAISSFKAISPNNHKNKTRRPSGSTALPKKHPNSEKYGGPLVPLLHTVKQTRSWLKPCFLCAIVLVFHTNISLLLRNWPPQWK